MEEALDIAANGLMKIRDEKGVKALAGFWLGQGVNEEAYLFQKLVRTGLAPTMSITALGYACVIRGGLMEGLNSGAVSDLSRPRWMPKSSS